MKCAKIFVQLFGRLALTCALRGCKNSHFNPFPSYASVLKVAPIFTSFLLIFVRKISKNTS